MPIVYNPSVNDRSGEILAAGIAGAGQIRADAAMQNANNLAAGIGSASRSIGGAVAQAGQEYQATKAKLSSSYGKIDALTQAGWLPPEEADKLAKIKDPDKLAGAMAVYETQFASDLSRKRQMDVRNMEMMADQQRQASDRTGQTISIKNPATGQDETFIFQNNRQIMPMNRTEAKEQGVQSVQKIQVSPNEYIYVDQAGRPINRNTINSPLPDPTGDAQRRNLQSQKAYLEGEKAKGRGGAKDGANWWPWSETIDQRLAGVDASLKALDGGTATDTTKPAPAGAQPVKITSKAEYDKLPSGAQYIGPSGQIATKP